MCEMLVKYTILMLGVVAFWGVLTTETDERRWRLAAYTTICLVLGLIAWLLLQ